MGGLGRGEEDMGEGKGAVVSFIFYFLFLKRNPCFLKVDVEILL